MVMLADLTVPEMTLLFLGNVIALGVMVAWMLWQFERWQQKRRLGLRHRTSWRERQ